MWSLHAERLALFRRVVRVLEAFGVPEELVDVVVVALARVADGLPARRPLPELGAHRAVQGRDDAREEPAGGPAAARRVPALPELRAHLVEEIAEALGHVTKVARLAPDEDVEAEVDELVLRHVALARALRRRAELLRPRLVVGQQLAVQRGEAVARLALMRGRCAATETCLLQSIVVVSSFSYLSFFPSPC